MEHTPAASTSSSSVGPEASTRGARRGRGGGGGGGFNTASLASGDDAHGRGGAAPPKPPPPQPHPPPPQHEAEGGTTELLQSFASMRAQLDAHQERRERLIRASRDATTSAKRLIFLLHRVPPSAAACCRAGADQGEGATLADPGGVPAPTLEVARGEDQEQARMAKPPKCDPAAHAESRGAEAGETPPAAPRPPVEAQATTPAQKRALEILREAETKRDEMVAALRGVAEQEGLTEGAQRGGGDDDAGAEVEVGASGGGPATAQLGGEEDEGQRALRYERSLGPGIEEMVEALSFLHYLRHGTLISLDEVQALFLTPSGEKLLPIPTSRYLLGLCDLTGELMRFATNAMASGGGQGGSAAAAPDVVVRSVLSLLRRMRDAFEAFVPLVRDMRKKQQTTSASVRKIEDLLYALAVRSSEYGSEPAMLQEMVRRAMASAAAASSSSASAGGMGGDRDGAVAPGEEAWAA